MTLRLRIRPTSIPARRLALAAAVLGALALSPAVAPAGAMVVEAGAVKAGMQPRNEAFFLHGRTISASEFANPSGASIVASARTYAIYWDPTDHYHGDWQHLVDTFFQGMGEASADSLFAVAGQYTDKANQHATSHSTFVGATTDTTKYPLSGCTDPHPLAVKDQIELENKHAPICLTDKQIQEELERFIAQHAFQKGMGTIFYVLTPPGVTVCLDAGGPKGHCSDYVGTSLEESYENSFCSYHSDVSLTSPANGDANTILYAVIPWTAGGVADGHLLPEDETPAYNCQDGAFDPSSKPIEQKEKKKEKNKKEEEEFKEKTVEAKQEQELKEALEGPHQEEPNQPASVGPDGFYDTGLADLIINQIAVEQQNTVTDPLLNAWQDPAGNEATDECRNFFAPILGGSVTANELSGAGSLYNQTLGAHNYYLNDAFDLAALKLPYPGVPCLIGLDLVPQFTAPNPANAGEIVDFNGMESDITLNWGTKYSATGEPEPTYATYKWNFGDGTPEVSGYAPGTPPGNPPGGTLCEEPWLAPCAASTFHSYQYGGTYEVTLTVTDIAGNVATVVHPITVVGPPPPPPPPPPAPPTPPTPPGGSPGGSASVPATPGPEATAAATSSSLKQVARSGLVVHYSVNEQVAGHFEVLLSAAIAHRLRISGPTATGLPAGFPRSLVIAKALLVTTKGGHSTVRIKFSKRTAARLRRAHNVTLTLRLIVHNASQQPIFTTVTSTVALHR